MKRLVVALVLAVALSFVAKPAPVRADACDMSERYSGHSKWWNMLCYWESLIDEAIN